MYIKCLLIIAEPTVRPRNQFRFNPRYVIFNPALYAFYSKAERMALKVEIEFHNFIERSRSADLCRILIENKRSNILLLSQILNCAYSYYLVCLLHCCGTGYATFFSAFPNRLLWVIAGR